MPAQRRNNSRQVLEHLLAERNEHPERLAEIDRRIWDAFGETHAVWVLDMCGFSRLTVRHGITHFLAMIQRLHGLARPLIAEAGGKVIKTEADNVFATFDDAPAAVAAARQVQQRLAEANRFLPEDWDLHASIGVGYGDLLLIEGDDLYGSEMNLASKLGEDVAGPGEIYLTEAARARCAAAGEAVAAEERTIVTGGLSLRAYRLV